MSSVCVGEDLGQLLTGLSAILTAAQTQRVRQSGRCPWLAADSSETSVRANLARLRLSSITVSSRSMASSSATALAPATLDEAVSLVVSVGSDLAQVSAKVVPALAALFQQASTADLLARSLDGGADPLAVLAATDHFGAGFLYLL
jgi:hypothetical protein